MVLKTRRALILALLAILALPLTAATYEEGRQAYIDSQYKKALKILSPLAKAGNADAQKMLGIMYDYGHGVKANQDKAMEWYLRAANQGHSAVQYQVGAKYFRGDGVDKNIKEAAHWWGLSAAGGQIEAQFNLALLYFRGLEIEQDDRKAASLFRQSAEQGHGHAQYSLAVMHAFGRGVEKDYETALKWFQQSASQGVAQAQFNLGVFYENGYAIDKDLPTAKLWYERAANQGLNQAQARLEQLTAVEVAQADGIVHPDDSQTQQLANRAANTESTAIFNPKQQPKLLEQPGPVIADTVIAKAGDTAGETVGPVVNAIPVLPPPAEAEPLEPLVEEPRIEEPRNAAMSERQAWVKQQAANSYTLQLSSVLSENAIIKFINNNKINDKAIYVEVLIKGQTRYNALYGAYSSYEEAQQAIDTLPENIQRGKPWVRNFGLLQKLLN